MLQVKGTGKMVCSSKDSNGREGRFSPHTIFSDTLMWKWEEAIGCSVKLAHFSLFYLCMRFCFQQIHMNTWESQQHERKKNNKKNA